MLQGKHLKDIQKKQWINASRLVVDVLVLLALCLMLGLWTAKYLLAGAPLPDAEDSRYRSRIYRGMSMTV